MLLSLPLSLSPHPFQGNKEENVATTQNTQLEFTDKPNLLS